MNSDVNSSFLLLRPTCVALAESPTLGLLLEVTSLIQRLPPDHVQKLQEYLLFPLVNIFKTPCKGQEEMSAASAAAIKAILKVSTVASFSVYKDLVMVLFVALNPPTARHFVAKSEECQEDVVHALTVLLHSTSHGVLLQFYHAAHLAAIGHGVSTLLKLVETVPSRRVKLASLECLAELGQVRRSREDGVFHRASACFASFLPGIVLSLSKVITGDTKVGQMVISRSIDVWTDVVTLVMADSHCPEVTADGDSVRVSTSAGGGQGQTAAAAVTTAVTSTGVGGQLVVRRTPEWTAGAAEKLGVLLKVICERSVGHASHRVRLSAARLADKCLSQCTRSLARSTQTLLEVLIGLVGDEQPLVTTYCLDALKSFDESVSPAVPVALDAELLAGGRLPTMHEILEDNIFVFTSRLPRLLQQPDDDARLASLRLLRGYLTVLGTRMDRLLNSSAHLQRLMHAFSQVLELRCGSLQLLCEATPSSIAGIGAAAAAAHEEDLNDAEVDSSKDVADSGGCSSTEERQHRRHVHGKLWRQFKHFDDERLWKELSACCHLLGRYGNVIVLTDHLLDMMNESGRYEKEAALILNEVLRGYGSTFGDARKSKEDGMHSLAPASEVARGVAKDVVREYLDKLSSTADARIPRADVGKRALVKSAKGAVDDGVISRANGQILFTCILLDGLSVAVRIAGTGCEYLLIDSLYTLLDRLSDDTLLVSQTAYVALEEICHALHHGSIDQLLFRHADYIVNSLALKLRRLSYYPRAPLVLQAMLKHSDRSILPYVEDVIIDVMNTLDSSHDETTARMILHVLNTLLSCMCRWYPQMPVITDEVAVPVKDKVKSSEGDHGHSKISVQSQIKDGFLDYCRQKFLATDQEMTDVVESSGVGSSAEAASLEEDMNTWASEQASQADPPTDTGNTAEKPDAPPPLHITLANRVLERCSHMLSHDCVRVRIAALKAATHGFQVLRSMENVLLPAVHRLWAPLVGRFSDTEPAVILAAFECLHVLAELSKDFIRQRVSKEVMPRLCSFLRSQSSVSVKTGPAYTYTTSFRLQRVLLTRLGSIVKDVDISSKDLDLICNACLPYLSCRQPLLLQEECLHCFKLLAAIDADAIWLKLNLLYCHQPPPPPHSCFSSVKFFASGHVPHAPEFAENVTQLMQSIG